jgi:hypothetical protein
MSLPAARFRLPDCQACCASRVGAWPGREGVMKRYWIAAFCIFAWLGSALCARAQPAGTSLGVSYTYLQVLEEESMALPAGWVFSLAGGGDHVVVPLLEVGGSFRPASSSVLQLYTVQGGARFGPPAHPGRTRPFLQILGGVGTAVCCGDATILVLVEPGGGVDIPLSRRTSLQVAAGLPLVFGEGGRANVLRLRAGVSIELGKGR